MLTKNDLKLKYGDDIILLFKGEEPFTEVNNAPAGMLIERDSKVLCNECGEWHKSLGSHIRHKHNMTASEYKKKYGYNKSTGLCSKDVSNKISDSATESNVNRTFKVEYRKMGQIASKGKREETSMQKRNKFNTCPEQIKKRMEMLVAKFGNNITLNQVEEHDSGLKRHANSYYGGWNNFKKEFGMELNIRGSENIKETADLIYDLREYVKNNLILPWKNSKYTGDFPHSKSTYKHRFGSFAKAWVSCGIEKEGYNYIVVN